MTPKPWPAIALVAACFIAAVWTAPAIHHSGSLMLTGLVLAAVFIVGGALEASVWRR